MPHGSDLTDADIAHMLGWQPSIFTRSPGTLSAVIRHAVDEAARRERKACAGLVRANAEACCLDGGMRAVLEANAEAIEARGKA